MGDNVIRKSSWRFIFILDRKLVSWCFKKQAIVALLSIKAEYVAVTFATKEATWIILLLTELGLLDKKDQYAKIKVGQRSKEIDQIKANVVS